MRFQSIIGIFSLSVGMFSGVLVTPGFAAEQLFTEQPSVTPELAQRGAHQVGVITQKISNPGQLDTRTFAGTVDRQLTLEIWYPAAPRSSSKAATYSDETRSGIAFTLQGTAFRGAPGVSTDRSFPLVVMSHGYTGYRAQFFFLAEHLASHGYIVASIDHTDSTNADVDFSKDGGSGFVSTLYNRARDQQFVLQYLAGSKLAVGNVNAGKSAVLGYSMGGYGALNTAGGCYDFTPSGLITMGFPADSAQAVAPLFNFCAAGRDGVDPRWKALIAIAPWGGEPNVHAADSLGKVRIPALLIAGEEDDISGFEHGVKKLYRQLGSKDKYLMVYESARHNITGHPAPAAAFGNDLDMGHYYEPSWDAEAMARINQHMLLAFLDCYIKADERACNYLPLRQDITQTKQADGKLTPPWPGFRDRWGAGVQFIRSPQ